MQATFLGTGTSCGVPMIGCDCAVCLSQDPRDRRRRTSLYLSCGDLGILIDTPPDFRVQALQYRVPRVDAVFFTHSHADHIFGFDDIRRYNTMQGGVIPAYADPSTIADLQRIFHYISAPNTLGTYRPEISFCEMRGSVTIGEVSISALPVQHGTQPTFGYLFTYAGKSLAYVPDCKEMPAHTVSMVRGVDVMILDALRHRQHATHMTIEESLQCLDQIGANTSYLIHMCHEVGHAALSQSLPKGVHVAYDGLVLDI